MTNQSIEGYLIFRDTQLDSGRTVRPLVPLVPLAPLATPVTLVLSRLLLFQSVAGPKSLEALQEFQELPRRLLRKHFAGTVKG